MLDGITTAGTDDDAVAEDSPICDEPVVCVFVKPPLLLTLGV